VPKHGGWARQAALAPALHPIGGQLQERLLDGGPTPVALELFLEELPYPFEKLQKITWNGLLESALDGGHDPGLEVPDPVAMGEVVPGRELERAHHGLDGRNPGRVLPSLLHAPILALARQLHRARTRNSVTRIVRER
jgi:hypothetical protein